VIQTDHGFQLPGKWQGRRHIAARDEIERAIEEAKRTDLDNWFHRHWYIERDSLIRLMQGKRVLKRGALSDGQDQSWRDNGVSRRGRASERWPTLGGAADKERRSGRSRDIGGAAGRDQGDGATAVERGTDETDTMQNLSVGVAGAGA
jgi:hypothetical protein